MHKQLNNGLQARLVLVVVYVVVLVLFLSTELAFGHMQDVTSTPTLTYVADTTPVPAGSSTVFNTVTPTAIVATTATITVSETPIELTFAVTPTIVTTTPLGALPVPLQMQCGPRLLPCGCPTPQLRYVFPVQPPEAADYGEAHHDYPATDIFAPYRSVFVAVTNGVIDELSYDDHWDPAQDDPALRSGRYVTIIGDDGVRYHGSHLDELVPGLAAGERVVAGQLLGYVGNSGNAAGIAYHLHFGISHPTFSGDWETRRGELSPYPFLQAWKRNEIMTPDLSQLQR